MSASSSSPPQKFLIKKAKLPAAPPGRRPIGFRGNHQHGKPLYDPVYPTTKVPTSLVPRYPTDWRNGGRALLCACMAIIADGVRIRRHKKSLLWQKGGVCADRCGTECAKSPWRCLCSWRVRDVYKHIVNMDGMLMKYKGYVQLKNNQPLFSVKNQVACKNKYKAEAMSWSEELKKYVYSERVYIHPAFNILPDRDVKQNEEENIKEYESEDEKNLSDSEAEDSDYETS